MEVVGEVQQILYQLRKTGTHDKMPIVALANQLDQALRAEKPGEDAPCPACEVRQLAHLVSRPT